MSNPDNSSSSSNMSYSTNRNRSLRTSLLSQPNTPVNAPLSIGEQLNLATEDGMNYSLNNNPLAPRNYTPRAKNPSFQDPAVKRVLARLHTKLEEASKKMGDINKDVHRYITVPLFSTQNLGSVPQIRNLWDGGKSIARRDGTTKQYASPQYGWFQNFITQYIVYDLIRRNLGQIVSQTAMHRKQPITNLKVFRMKFPKEVRIWWATHSNVLLPAYSLDVKNKGLSFIAQNPFIRDVFVKASEAKGFNKTVPQHMGADMVRNMQTILYSFNDPLQSNLGSFSFSKAYNRQLQNQYYEPVQHIDGLRTADSLSNSSSSSSSSSA